ADQLAPLVSTLGDGGRQRSEPRLGIVERAYGGLAVAGRCVRFGCLGDEVDAVGLRPGSAIFERGVRRRDERRQESTCDLGRRPPEGAMRDGARGGQQTVFAATVWTEFGPEVQ